MVGEGLSRLYNHMHPLPLDPEKVSLHPQKAQCLVAKATAMQCNLWLLLASNANMGLGFYGPEEVAHLQISCLSPIGLLRCSLYLS